MPDLSLRRIAGQWAADAATHAVQTARPTSMMSTTLCLYVSACHPSLGTFGPLLDRAKSTQTPAHIIIPPPFVDESTPYPFVTTPRSAFCTHPSQRRWRDWLASVGSTLVILLFLTRLRFLQRKALVERDQLFSTASDYAVQLSNLPIIRDEPSSSKVADDDAFEPPSRLATPLDPTAQASRQEAIQRPEHRGDAARGRRAPGAPSTRLP